MRTKLKPYRGKLSAEQIVEGMNAAVRNARRLADDAKIMLDSSRYPTAVALAILSIEETGKLPILRGIAVESDDYTLQRKWKTYRNHQKKNRNWVLPDLIEQGTVDWRTLMVVLDDKAEHPMFLEQLKQLSLYTNCLDNADWSEPEEAIEKELAFKLVDCANQLAMNKIYTLKEIELWIAHMKPVQGTTVEEMTEALSNWHNSMKKEGLHKGDHISPEDFFKGLKN